MHRIALIMTMIILGSNCLLGQAVQNSRIINISNVKAYEKDDRIFVEWTADAGEAGNYWEVQGSRDAKEFHAVSLVLGPDPGKPGEQYTFKGKPARVNDKFYRVVHIGLTGPDTQTSGFVQVEKQVSLSAKPRQ